MALTRRSFLADTGMGFTGLALGALLFRDGVARADRQSRRPTASRTSPRRRKRVIWLFMGGGISQIESFDPKPELNKYAGKTIAETPYKRRPRTRPHLKQRDRRQSRPHGGQPRSYGPEHRPSPSRPERPGRRRLVAARRLLRRRHRRRPLAVDTDNDHGAQLSCTPAGTSSRAPSRPSAPGSITASARSTTTCRSTSSSARRPATAAAASMDHGAGYLGAGARRRPPERRRPRPAAVRRAGRRRHSREEQEGRVRACWAG